jgi:predicted HTH domain antitoxin
LYYWELSGSGKICYTYDRENDMQVTLDVPDMVNISQTDAQLLFAMKLFEADKLPLGKAAEVAGLSYRAFYELLKRYGIPVVTMTEEDVKWEIENARKSR